MWPSLNITPSRTQRGVDFRECMNSRNGATSIAVAKLSDLSLSPFFAALILRSGHCRTCFGKVICWTPKCSRLTEVVFLASVLVAHPIVTTIPKIQKSKKVFTGYLSLIVLVSRSVFRSGGPIAHLQYANIIFSRLSNGIAMNAPPCPASFRSGSEQASYPC